MIKRRGAGDADGRMDRHNSNMEGLYKSFAHVADREGVSEQLRHEHG